MVKVKEEGVKVKSVELLALFHNRILPSTTSASSLVFKPLNFHHPWSLAITLILLLLPYFLPIYEFLSDSSDEVSASMRGY